MAGRTPFHDIRARRGPDTPARAAMRDAYRRAMEEALRLAELREARGVTQVELAGILAVSQANVSQLERRDDLYLSTLQAYIEALGGRLVLTAVFPDRSVTLATPPAATNGEHAATLDPAREEVHVRQSDGPPTS